MLFKTCGAAATQSMHTSFASITMPQVKTQAISSRLKTPSQYLQNTIVHQLYILQKLYFNCTSKVTLALYGRTQKTIKTTTTSPFGSFSIACMVTIGSLFNTYLPAFFQFLCLFIDRTLNSESTEGQSNNCVCVVILLTSPRFKQT